jgi:hypothetical protein
MPDAIDIFREIGLLPPFELYIRWSLKLLFPNSKEFFICYEPNFLIILRRGIGELDCLLSLPLELISSSFGLWDILALIWRGLHSDLNGDESFFEIKLVWHFFLLFTYRLYFCTATGFFIKLSRA